MQQSYWSERRLSNRYVWSVLVFACLIVAGQLTGCRTLHISGTTSEGISITNDLGRDTAITTIIGPYKNQLDASMDVQLAILAHDLVKEQPESTLGNHIAAITRWCAARNSERQVDFGICNYGGIRVQSLTAGPLRVRDAYLILPFDNYVVYMDVSGATVRQFADHMAARGGWPADGLSYIITNGKADDIRVNGIPLDDMKVYRMALTDYVANGGDDSFFLKELSHENTAIYLRDAIMDYWRELDRSGREIEVEKDGRIRTE